MKFIIKLTLLIVVLIEIKMIILWYNEKSTNFSFLVCSIILTIFFVFQLLLLLLRFKIINTFLYNNLLVLACSTAGSIILAEEVLRIFDQSLQGHNEMNGDNYQSPFFITLNRCKSCDDKYFYINEHNATRNIGNDEFHYLHSYNSYGVRDIEFDENKKKNEFRILGLGDSFTEGVGTCADSTWLKQLAFKLNVHQDSILYTTMNGGVHGSNLFFSYELLSQCLVKFKPNLVILDLNSTDLADVSRCGGYKGFDPNGNFIPIHGPWWEIFYGSSYIVRFFVLKILDEDWEFHTAEDREKAEKISLDNISKKINDFQVLAEKDHFDFLLILQPLSLDLRYSDRFLNLKIDTSVRKINLYPYFSDKIRVKHIPESIYYWPKDGHFNSFGYGEMANQLYQKYFIYQSAKKDKIM